MKEDVAKFICEKAGVEYFYNVICKREITLEILMKAVFALNREVNKWLIEMTHDHFSVKNLNEFGLRKKFRFRGCLPPYDSEEEALKACLTYIYENKDK